MEKMPGEDAIDRSVKELSKPQFRRWDFVQRRANKPKSLSCKEKILELSSDVDLHMRKQIILQVKSVK